MGDRSREDLQDVLLTELRLNEMTEILELNGLEPLEMQVSKDIFAMACVLADAMIAGVHENCPICENSSLVWCSGRVSCWGSVGGTTRCLLLRRFLLLLLLLLTLILVPLLLFLLFPLCILLAPLLSSLLLLPLHMSFQDRSKHLQV